MNIRNILNDKALQDIPIIHILKVIDVVQKEIIRNEQSSGICEKLSVVNK